MEDGGELTKKLIDLLVKQNATPEEKKVLVLIKMALLGDSLVTFVKEVNAATQGFGKVSTDTVKRTVEYVKVHNEVQIRNTAFDDEQKERLIAQGNNLLTEVEVWILGALAYWGGADMFLCPMEVFQTIGLFKTMELTSIAPAMLPLLFPNSYNLK